MSMWTDRMTTIFTTLPPVWQWIAMVGGVFLLLSWLYVLSLVRSLRRTVDDLVADVRHTADRLSGTTLEQQGELIRRVGWAVNYLERMEQKLGSIVPSDVHVSSIRRRTSWSVRPSSTMRDAEAIPAAEAVRRANRESSRRVVQRLNGNRTGRLRLSPQPGRRSLAELPKLRVNESTASDVVGSISKLTPRTSFQSFT